MSVADVEAEITLRSTDAGGRTKRALSGYRPQHRVRPDYLTIGTHTYPDESSLAPGETTIGTIAFLNPEAYPHCLDVDDVIELSEEGRIVGRVRILHVLNPLLQRVPRTHLAVPDYAEWSDDSNPFPENWTVVDARASEALVAELHRELPADHILSGRQLRAIGRSCSHDDVLFESLDGDRAVFVVHLTWSRETDPTWPYTTRYDSVGHFFRRWPRDELDR